MRMQNRPTILFIAEAVTLAHFARIVTLAKSLNPSEYNIVIASDPRYLGLEKPFPFEFHPIHSIDSTDFTNSLAKGKPVYDAKTLTRYADEDLLLLNKIKPDIVIGDFRLSLSISAPLSQTPYASIVNAYWSPYANITYPIPDLPLTSLLGVGLAQKLFNVIRPLIFALHARPLNNARQRFGLPPLKQDLRESYTWSDFTLYTDIPEAVPLAHKPSNHYFLGPVLWSTKTILPDWWSSLPNDKPIVFITLGSSGQAELLPLLLEALAGEPLTIIATTADKIHITNAASNVFVTDYIPMDIASQRSQMVICNGGSLTTYQALTSGVPVIGIAGNMDQLLNMQTVERLGAGITLRASKVSHTYIKQAVNALLQSSSYVQAAKRVAQTLLNYNPAQRFPEILMKILTNLTTNHET